MDQTSCDKVEYMTDYFSQINFYMYEGPSPRIRSRNVPQDFYSCKYQVTHVKKNGKIENEQLQFSNNKKVRMIRSLL